MFKKILALIVGASCIVANAIPNIWTGGFQQGYYGSAIHNSKNQHLQLSCDVGSGYGHSLFFESDEFPGEFNFGISLADENLELLLDDDRVLTSLDLHRNHKKFFTDIVSAKEIKVFKDNIIIGTFISTEKNRKAHLSRIKKNCT